MKRIEINEVLRTMFKNILSRGYKKTIVGKTALGGSGYTTFTKWIDKDKDHNHNFGLKPLEKIASLLNGEVHVVFLKENDHDFRNQIDEKNREFVSELNEKIVNYLDRYQSSYGKGQRSTPLNTTISEFLFEQYPETFQKPSSLEEGESEFISDDEAELEYE